MLCLCFTGCASKTNPPSETDTETRAEETTGKQIDENKLKKLQIRVYNLERQNYINKRLKDNQVVDQIIKFIDSEAQNDN